MGVRRFICWTTLIKPCAMASHRTMPPKMLTKMAVTLGSLVMRSKADRIASAVAPPPTSKKFAGEPPFNLMMSIVAMASPAPFTRQPMSPSNLMKLRPCLEYQLSKRLERYVTDSAALTSSASSCVVSRHEKISFCRNSALSSNVSLASIART
jgi:hypothetical protein